jgi:hypothetical protein
MNTSFIEDSPPVAGAGDAAESMWRILMVYVGGHSPRLEHHVGNGVGEIFISRRLLKSWYYHNGLFTDHRLFTSNPLLVSVCTEKGRLRRPELFSTLDTGECYESTRLAHMNL